MTKEELLSMDWKPHPLGLVYEINCKDCGEHCRVTKVVSDMEITYLRFNAEALTYVTKHGLEHKFREVCKHGRK